MKIKEQYDKRKKDLKNKMCENIKDFEDVTGTKVTMIISSNLYDAFTFDIYTNIDEKLK